jgi:importin-4
VLECSADFDLGGEAISSIAIQVLEQKSFCQQDPDQDEDDEVPEDQAEYDSVLISSASDLVAALANVLGPEFTPAFNTFFPLISKYAVSTPLDDSQGMLNFLDRKNHALSLRDLRP